MHGPLQAGALSRSSRRKKGGGSPERALRLFERLYRGDRQVGQKPGRAETADVYPSTILRQPSAVPKSRLLGPLRYWLYMAVAATSSPIAANFAGHQCGAGSFHNRHSLS